MDAGNIGAVSIRDLRSSVTLTNSIFTDEYPARSINRLVSGNLFIDGNRFTEMTSSNTNKIRIDTMVIEKRFLRGH